MFMVQKVCVCVCVCARARVSRVIRALSENMFCDDGICLRICSEVDDTATAVSTSSPPYDVQSMFDVFGVNDTNTAYVLSMSSKWNGFSFFYVM